MASTLMLVAFFLPLALAGVIQVVGDRNDDLRDSLTVVFGLATFAAVIGMVPAVSDGLSVEALLLEVLPGVELAFSVEPLGMLYALVAAGLWVPTSLYAFGYMRGHHEKNQTRFFTCFALAIFAALGIAFSKNLFTLFLFYELLTFSTYPLVTHHGDDKAKKAGRIYLGILVFTSVTFLLLAVVWTWVATGTLDFTPGGILAGHIPDGMVPILLALFAFGTGKAALMPFHRWLPNAMVAPTPVSALLHAVAVVKAGVFTVLKVVVYVFGLDLLQATGGSDWLKWVAAFTIVVSSVIAIGQDNLKARLAYSTISQLAYIVLGAALATGASVLGGGMHIAMHAVGKITLFFVAGAIMVHTHKTNVSQLDGLGRKMPFTFGAFAIASLSIIGLPPTGGSWSKWFLASGAAQDPSDYVFVGVFMLSSLLSILYLGPVVARGFFLEARPDEHAHEAHGHASDEHGAEHPHAAREGLDEASLLCVGPLVFTALGCLAMFVLAEDLYAMLLPIAGGAG
jgi:multicomponent Na+:H+ antiporter subunit D